MTPFVAGAIEPAADRGYSMLSLLVATMLAQPANPGLLDAARAALRHPKVRSCVADRQVIEARHDEARAGQLPSLSLAAQLNRGTGNVVPGSSFATPGTPVSAGPPRGASFDSGTWTTIASLGVSFEVANFVRRMREVDAQLARVESAREREAVCALDAAYEAGSAFLDVAALTAALKAVDADRGRAEALRSRTAALAKAALRPGAELAQADAELAGVEARAATLRRDLRLAQARLAEAMGIEELPVMTLELPAVTASEREVAAHPRMRGAARDVDASERFVAVARTGYLPRLEVAAALWARGSGYPGAAGEQLGRSGNGLTPDVANWLAGVVVSWDIFDLPETRARVAGAEAEAAGRHAAYDATRLSLVNQLEGARASVVEAQAVLRHTAPAVEASRLALAQAEARYASGLSDFLDVARVRQLLTDAELAHIAAEVGLARATITLARAMGDVGALTEPR